MLEKESDDALWELADFLPNEVFCSFCPSELDREDSKACCTCGRAICLDCQTEIFTEIYCSDCGVCKVCHNEAIFACDKCGQLMCGEHIHERHYTEDSTGFRDDFLLCDRCLEKGN